MTQALQLVLFGQLLVMLVRSIRAVIVGTVDRQFRMTVDGVREGLR